MDRFEMIDLLYTFIAERFNCYYWKSASKYSYYSIDFASFKSYNDFLLSQELILYTKNSEELIGLLNIKIMVEKKQLQVMNADRMRPEIAYGMLFDTDGSVIICNSK